jgi:hypothetical protein
VEEHHVRRAGKRNQRRQHSLDGGVGEQDLGHFLNRSCRGIRSRELVRLLFGIIHSKRRQESNDLMSERKIVVEIPVRAWLVVHHEDIVGQLVVLEAIGVRR